jgi:hypothetical protein
MKALSITLFVLGLFWAYICLGFVIAPIRFFFVEPNFTGPFAVPLEFLLSVGLCVNALVGYWIWWGWLRHYRSRIFARRFFGISLIHHIIWLLFGAWVIADLNALLLPLSWVFLFWVVLNIAVCVVYFLRSATKATKPIEQVAASPMRVDE